MMMFSTCVYMCVDIATPTGNIDTSFRKILQNIATNFYVVGWNVWLRVTKMDFLPVTHTHTHAHTHTHTHTHTLHIMYITYL